MTDRELLQQALDALRHLCLHTAAIRGYDGEQVQTAIDALKARLAQPENKFNPDWDAMAVMVEEQQRMAKRIEELTQLVTSQGIRLMDAEAQLESELFEYWNAVEGWVKIDEVRQHFDTAGCGTIYKTGGEGRVPLYTTPQREWVGLTDEEMFAVLENLQEMYNRPPTTDSRVIFARAIEAKLKEKNT
jgi:hypothetical protein